MDAFTAMWIASGGPKDAALFVGHPDRRTYDFYLSPGAVRIAEDLIVRFACVECPRPEGFGLALLVGDQNAIALLKSQGK
jgi:hypothetical protein